MADSWPEPHEFIVELREAVGLYAGARSVAPRTAWLQALAAVRRVIRERDEYERILRNLGAVPEESERARP